MPDSHRYIGVIVILKIVRSGFCPIPYILLELLPGHSIFIVISGILLYRRSLYRGSVPYILLELLPGHSIFIVISGILLYRRSLFRGSTVMEEFSAVFLQEHQSLSNEGITR